MYLGPPPAPSPDWSYYLDFDGTIVLIAETPDAVVVPPGLPALLMDLRRITGGGLAILTGRPLDSIMALLGPLPIAIAGQHGLEWQDETGLRMAAAIPADDLAAVRGPLKAFVSTDARLLLEDKGLSIALHYRRAPELGPAVRSLATNLAEFCGGRLELIAGKAVVEFRPAGVHKGVALRRFQERWPFAGRRPVMIGDDRTDEDGFDAASRAGGIGIHVGSNRDTRAGFALADVHAVHAWLAQLVDNRC